MRRIQQQQQQNDYNNEISEIQKALLTGKLSTSLRERASRVSQKSYYFTSPTSKSQVTSPVSKQRPGTSNNGKLLQERLKYTLLEKVRENKENNLRAYQTQV